MIKIMFVFIFLSTQAFAQTTTQYNSSNQMIGKTICSGSVCKFYNSSNQMTGRSEIRSNGDVYYYDDSNRIVRIDRKR